MTITESVILTAIGMVAVLFFVQLCGFLLLITAVAAWNWILWRIAKARGQ